MLIDTCTRPPQTRTENNNNNNITYNIPPPPFRRKNSFLPMATSSSSSASFLPSYTRARAHTIYVHEYVLVLWGENTYTLHVIIYLFIRVCYYYTCAAGARGEIEIRPRTRTNVCSEETRVVVVVVVVELICIFQTHGNRFVRTRAINAFSNGLWKVEKLHHNVNINLPVCVRAQALRSARTGYLLRVPFL